MKRTFIIFVLMTVLSSAYGVDIYVVPGQSIQAAIDASAPGSNIIVLPGRYKENINFKGKAIKLTSLDPNDPTKVNTTIIDGNNPADANFASTVTFNSSEGNGSILTGFTITGGTGTWALISWQLVGLTWNRCGGGIVCYNKAEPTIIKNIIKDNLAAQGGGIFIYGNPVNPNSPSNPAVHIKPRIIGNIFINNHATKNHGFIPPNTLYPNYDHGDGGAITCFQACDALITANTIIQNIADFYGSGIFLRQWCNGTIANNEIDQNHARFGTVHLTYSAGPLIQNNNINANIASALGGGIYIYYLSNPVIADNIIINNCALGGTAGGIGSYWDSNPVIKNNLIAKNSSTKGGGIYANSGSISLSYNTISGNTAGKGSGICLEYDVSAIVTGNIVAPNIGSSQIYGEESVVLQAAFNDVWSPTQPGYEGLPDSTGENGNISEDPKLASVDNNDFTLTVYSPCINGGDPNFVPDAGQKDLNGDDRIMGQYVDIGADEAWSVWNITKNKKYKKIQDAVSDSNNFQTVIAGRGRYFEKIDFGAHQLILSSADANDLSVVEKTIIDANLTGPAVTIANKQDANTVFRGFTVTNGGNSNGGGIVCKASPIIEKNIVTKCQGTNGGGLYFTNNGTKPIVRSNIITANTAEFGGGLVCDSSSEVTIIGNYFRDNKGSMAGGAISCFAMSKAAYIKGNEFLFNKAIVGAALMLEQTYAKTLIEGNIFAGNRAGFSGGAITCSQADPNIVNNTFISNRSIGGYDVNTGVISLEVDSNPLIANNIIAHSDYGLGIFSYNGQGYPPCNPVIFNNNVYDCIDGAYGGGIADKTGTNGNISSDPHIAHKGYWIDPNTPANPSDDFYIPGNYHIRPDSPSVNTGNNSLVPVKLTTDIDDEQRIFETVVDMGADEVVKNPFDLNTDGIVDSNELSVLTAHWLESASGLPVDFYQDGSIDFLDLAVLGQQWYWKGGWFDGNYQVPQPPEPNESPCQEPNGICFDSYTSCIAHWALDELSGLTALEHIGSKNGALINFPIDNSQWIAGKINNSLKFDGSNDYLSTDFSSLKTANDFTITFWLKAADTTFGTHIIWEGDSAANGWGPEQEMHISLGNLTETSVSENNKLSFYMSSNTITSGKSLHIAADFADTSSWHFVAVKVGDLSSNPYAQMYIDGISVGNDAMNAADLSRSNWGTALRFGIAGVTGGRPRPPFFNGTLDNVLIYNRGLTADEILELYNAPNQ